MILLLTKSEDPHADQVETLLRERGVDWLRFNPASFPTEASVSLMSSIVDAPRAELRWNGQTIHSEEVKAVWYRRPEFPVPDSRIADPRVRALVEGECDAVVNDLWQTLDALWAHSDSEQYVFAG